MSKKPELRDLPGLGQKIEERLREAGIKTVLNLSRANADKLAEKVDGLSVSRAEALIAAAQEALEPTSAPVKEMKPKKVEAKEEQPEKRVTSKKAPKEVKPEEKTPMKATGKAVSEKKKEIIAEKPKPSKKERKAKPKVKEPKKKKYEVPVRFKNVDQRLLKIARSKKMRMPPFRAENAHRWTRVSGSWRQVRGIDSYTRQKKKGRLIMVSTGYRTPRVLRNLHPSLFIEIPVYKPLDLENLDPDIHAVRISATVGAKKRQEILAAADEKLLRVLNPGTKEEIGEEDLFTDLDLEEEKT